MKEKTNGIATAGEGVKNDGSQRILMQSDETKNGKDMKIQQSIQYEVNSKTDNASLEENSRQEPLADVHHATIVDAEDKNEEHNVQRTPEELVPKTFEVCYEENSSSSRFMKVKQRNIDVGSIGEKDNMLAELEQAKPVNHGTLPPLQGNFETNGTKETIQDNVNMKDCFQEYITSLTKSLQEYEILRKQYNVDKESLQCKLKALEKGKHHRIWSENDKQQYRSYYTLKIYEKQVLCAVTEHVKKVLQVRLEECRILMAQHTPQNTTTATSFIQKWFSKSNRQHTKASTQMTSKPTVPVAVATGAVAQVEVLPATSNPIKTTEPFCKPLPVLLATNYNYQQYQTQLHYLKISINRLKPMCQSIDTKCKVLLSENRPIAHNGSVQLKQQFEIVAILSEISNCVENIHSKVPILKDNIDYTYYDRLLHQFRRLIRNKCTKSGELVRNWSLKLHQDCEIQVCISYSNAKQIGNRRNSASSTSTKTNCRTTATTTATSTQFALSELFIPNFKYTSKHLKPKLYTAIKVQQLPSKKLLIAFLKYFQRLILQEYGLSDLHLSAQQLKALEVCVHYVIFTSIHKLAFAYELQNTQYVAHSMYYHFPHSMIALKRFPLDSIGVSIKFVQCFRKYMNGCTEINDKAKVSTTVRTRIFEIPGKENLGSFKVEIPEMVAIPITDIYNSASIIGASSSSSDNTKINQNNNNNEELSDTVQDNNAEHDCFNNNEKHMVNITKNFGEYGLRHTTGSTSNNSNRTSHYTTCTTISNCTNNDTTSTEHHPLFTSTNGGIEHSDLKYLNLVFKDTYHSILSINTETSPYGITNAILKMMKCLHTEVKSLYQTTPTTNNSTKIRGESNNSANMTSIQDSAFEMNADLLIPILVIILLQNNVKETLRLIRRLQLVQSFAFMYLDEGGEAEYYLTCIEAALAFICTFPYTGQDNNVQNTNNQLDITTESKNSQVNHQNSLNNGNTEFTAAITDDNNNDTEDDPENGTNTIRASNVTDELHDIVSHHCRDCQFMTQNITVWSVHAIRNDNNNTNSTNRTNLQQFKNDHEAIQDLSNWIMSQNADYHTVQAISNENWML